MHVYIEMVLPSFLTLNGLREAGETSEAARLLKKTPGLTKADHQWLEIRASDQFGSDQA